MVWVCDTAETCGDSASLKWIKVRFRSPAGSYKSFDSPDFEVLALSTDQDGLALVKAFYQELGLRALRIYVEESGVPSLSLNVVGLPTTLLIDREGREIGRTVGSAEWDNPKLITVIRWYLDAPSAGALQSWSNRFFG